MCGIVGCWSLEGDESTVLYQAATHMADTLTHRGPDDSGVWADPEAALALGFRRLAIVDLTTEGHQPMESETGRYILVFNGEVYNFLSLRHELEPLGHRFRGHSDTEVMLAAIEEWGLERAVRRFVGMFAFALWDRRERQLSLVRDRMGIKPLYYGLMGTTFLIGSELKALRAHPAFRAEIDRGALTLLLRHNYIPSPYSIYRGISKLQPGHILRLDAPTDERSSTPFWSLQGVIESGVQRPFIGSDDEAVDELDTMLRDAVRLRMIADVPLGAFLSGGIDSSTVVALMQEQSSQPVRTFSIGFHEDRYNEAQHARAVSQHLGTSHTELYVTPDEAQAVIPSLPVMYDEPFSDSSQIPTYLVSRLARTQVTVSLSGDGGDELFGGYSQYLRAPEIWKYLGSLPAPARRQLARAIRGIAPSTYDRWLSTLMRFVRPRYGEGTLGGKLHTLADIIEQPTRTDLYVRMMSHWKAPADVVIDGYEPKTPMTNRGAWPSIVDFVHLMMYLDTRMYLPDDILTKVDRASMAVSLEARVPLLDHRVVEMAWSLPLSMKIRNGHGKWILRQVLYRYVPRSLVDRPKMGFGVPVGAWLVGPLRDWAEQLLDEQRLRGEGFFQSGPIRTRWHEHVTGERDWSAYLWDILMFQAWHEHWMPTTVTRPQPMLSSVAD
jgi:asparagine synthase (glutamine-hydrolysing)